MKEGFAFIVSKRSRFFPPCGGRGVVGGNDLPMNSFQYEGLISEVFFCLSVFLIRDILSGLRDYALLSSGLKFTRRTSECCLQGCEGDSFLPESTFVEVHDRRFKLTTHSLRFYLLIRCFFRWSLPVNVRPFLFSFDLSLHERGSILLQMHPLFSS